MLKFIRKLFPQYKQPAPLTEELRRVECPRVWEERVNEAIRRDAKRHPEKYQIPTRNQPDRYFS